MLLGFLVFSARIDLKRAKPLFLNEWELLKIPSVFGIFVVALLVFGIFSISAIWFLMKPTIADQNILTVVNGITSAVSTLAAFSGVIIVLFSRDGQFESSMRNQIYLAVMLIGCSLATLFSMFIQLVYSDLTVSLRFAMTSLLIVSETLLYLLACYVNSR